MAAIDFFYARPSCESCEKTRAFLVRAKSAIRSERSTRDPMSEAEIVALLGSVQEVWIARSGKVEKRPAKEVEPRDLLGPTGKFRAPMLKRGRKLMVGFHAASLESFAESH